MDMGCNVAAVSLSHGVFHCAASELNSLPLPNRLYYRQISQQPPLLGVCVFQVKRGASSWPRKGVRDVLLCHVSLAVLHVRVAVQTPVAA